LFLVLFTIYTIYKINKVVNMPSKSTQEETSTQSDKDETERVIPNENQTIAELDSHLFPYYSYGLESSSRRPHTPAPNKSFPLQAALSPISRFSSALNTSFSPSFSTCDKNEESNDINDIFGANYDQCHEGKILDAEGKIPIYNRGCFEMAPFRR
jgi:hypothetical protein